MANLFTALLNSPEPETNDHSQVTGDVSTELSDDLPLPDGEDVPHPATLKHAIDQADLELATPTATRPSLAAIDSSANIMGAPVQNSKDSKDSNEETMDDPNEDVMSLATDVNQHARALDDIRGAIAKMSRQLEIIPALDARIRTLTSENDELKSTIKRLSSDMTQIKQSFNLYQSSTANKIADVERRAAEKQLRLDVPVETEAVIPPSELSVSRDTPSSSSQQGGIPLSPPAAVEKKKKKVAILSDF